MLEVLRGNETTLAEGSHVFEGQERAIDDGFRNVSKIWYDQTKSYEDGLAEIDAGKAVTEDVLCTVSNMTPTTENGQFVFYHQISERVFRPTAHAMSQVGNIAGCGTWFVNSLLTPATDAKGREVYQRDAQDAATLATVIQNGFRRLKSDKKYLFRTRQDGTLRAMMTDKYACVDNRWYVEVLRKLIPGGRLSHFTGDSDTIYGNILIPDTIRAESDSDYGGMLSIGNSEIGERRVSSLPSIFRAICMNGCIWGATVGKGIKQVHRGKINLERLAAEIKTNLEAQIPLLPQGIDALLSTQGKKWDNVSAFPMLAAVVNSYNMSKPQAKALLKAYDVEGGKTLFSLVNAVTRAGQKLSNPEWLKFDTIGGEMVSYTDKDFGRLVTNALDFSSKEVEELLGLD